MQNTFKDIFKRFLRQFIFARFVSFGDALHIFWTKIGITFRQAQINKFFIESGIGDVKCDRVFKDELKSGHYRMHFVVVEACAIQKFGDFRSLD